MIKFFKKLFNRKPTALMMNQEFKIVPAFTWRGTTYHMYENPLDASTGRGLTALMYMEELLMRCSVDYLKDHAEAIDLIISNQRINIGDLARLNENLKERINFLIPVPEDVFKVASVIFFSGDENQFKYNEAFNKEKIEAWSKDPEMYDFLMQQSQLKNMLQLPQLSSAQFKTYSAIEQKTDAMHRDELKRILMKNKLISKNIN